MEVEAADIIPMLQEQLGALMIENAALRAQIVKMQKNASNQSGGSLSGQPDEE